MPEQTGLRQRQRRAARAETQERDGDDHVGEMVPADDREEPHQQHFVGDDGGRDRGHRGERRPAHFPSARVNGTNCTGRSWRVVTPPSGSFSTSMSCCVAKDSADRDYHPSAGLQLFDERRRDVARSGGNDDPVERRRLRPAVVAVRHLGFDIGDSRGARAPTWPSRRAPARSRWNRPAPPAARGSPPDSRSRCRSPAPWRRA